MTGDEVAHIDHVAQFANVLRSLNTLEQVFSLLKQKVEAFPGTAQTQVAPDDSHVGAHNLAHLLHVLVDKDLFLVRHRSLVVPCRHTLVEVIFVYSLQTVLGSSVGIYNSLDE